MRRCVASTTRTTCDRRWSLHRWILGNRARPVDRSARLQLGLDRFAQILRGDADRSATCRALRAHPRARPCAYRPQRSRLTVPTSRMLPKPFIRPGSCAILQHVDDLAPLEVNDDSPVSATLSPAPIVDACHPYRRPRAETGDLPVQMPQNGVSSLTGMPRRFISRSATKATELPWPKR